MEDIFGGLFGTELQLFYEHETRPEGLTSAPRRWANLAGFMVNKPLKLARNHQLPWFGRSHAIYQTRK